MRDESLIKVIFYFLLVSIGAGLVQMKIPLFGRHSKRWEEQNYAQRFGGIFFLALLFFMPFPSSCLFPSLFLIFLYLFILLASSFSLSFSAFSLLRLLGLPVPSAVFRRLFPLSFFVMKFSLLLIGSILISLP